VAKKNAKLLMEGRQKMHKMLKEACEFYHNNAIKIAIAILVTMLINVYLTVNTAVWLNVLLAIAYGIAYGIIANYRGKNFPIDGFIFCCILFVINIFWVFAARSIINWELKFLLPFIVSTLSALLIYAVAICAMMIIKSDNYGAAQQPEIKDLGHLW